MRGQPNHHNLGRQSALTSGTLRRSVYSNMGPRPGTNSRGNSTISPFHLMSNLSEHRVLHLLDGWLQQRRRDHTVIMCDSLSESRVHVAQIGI
jgi:hypothetical protein